jgi:hypothetical protein
LCSKILTSLWSLYWKKRTRKKVSEYDFRCQLQVASSLTKILIPIIVFHGQPAFAVWSVTSDEMTSEAFAVWSVTSDEMTSDKMTWWIARLGDAVARWHGTCFWLVKHGMRFCCLQVGMRFCCCLQVGMRFCCLQDNLDNHDCIRRPSASTAKKQRQEPHHTLLVTHDRTWTASWQSSACKKT